METSAQPSVYQAFGLSPPPFHLRKVSRSLYPLGTVSARLSSLFYKHTVWPTRVQEELSKQREATDHPKTLKVSSAIQDLPKGKP